MRFPKWLLALLFGSVAYGVTRLAVRFMPRRPWSVGIVSLVALGLLGFWAVALRDADDRRVRRTSQVLVLLIVVIVMFGARLLDAVL